MTRANQAGTIPGTLSAEIMRLARAGLSRGAICKRLRHRASYNTLQATLSSLTARGHKLPQARPLPRYGAQLRHLIRSGASYEEAGRALGVSGQSVAKAVSRYRAEGGLCPSVTLGMDGDLWRRLEARAQAMGIPPAGLANALLETIARDDLFGAVMDDEAAV